MAALSLWILCTSLICVAAGTVFPHTDCFDQFVPENSSLTCRCHANDTAGSSLSSPTPTSFVWSGVAGNSDVLELPKVDRSMNGSRHTCIMRSGSVNRNVTYELRVAYGPEDAHTRILAPSPFITDGTRAVNLTCQVTNAYPAPGISWAFVMCKDGVPEPCEVTPEVKDDGKRIICTAIRPGHGQLVRSTAAFNFDLNYPPKTSPQIQAQSSKSILRSGDTITCTVQGGKPPVRRVLFNCSNPVLPDNPFDVIDPVTSSISSSVIVDTSRATAEHMECSCLGLWDPEPSLYGRPSTSNFSLEYRATINNFTANASTELVVMEENQDSVEFLCDVMARSSARVTLYRQRDKNRHLGDIVEVVGEEAARRKIQRYMVGPVRCEDMGVYICEAYSGYLRNSTDTVRLTVNCGPRPQTATTTSVVLRDPGSAVLELVAFPVPEHFSFVPVKRGGSDGGSGGRPNVPSEVVDLDVDVDTLFEPKCQGHESVAHLVTCRIERGAAEGEHSGLYNVTVSNAYGAFHFLLDVRPENEGAVITAQTAVLVSSLVAATVIIIVVVLVVFLMRKRRGRDVECTRVAHRRSLAAYIAENDDDPSNSPLPFVQVMPISSDIQYKSTDPSNNPVPFSHILPSLSSDGVGSHGGGDDVIVRSESRHEGLVTSSGVLLQRAASGGNSQVPSSPVPRAEVSPFFPAGERLEKEEEEGDEDKGTEEKGDVMYFQDEDLTHGDDGNDEYPTIPTRSRTSRGSEKHTEGEGHRSDHTVEGEIVWMDSGADLHASPHLLAVPPDIPLGEYAGLDDNATDESPSDVGRTRSQQRSASPLQSLVSAGSRSRTFITKIYLPNQSSNPDSPRQQEQHSQDPAAPSGPVENEYAVVVKKPKGVNPSARPALEDVFPREQFPDDSSELSTPRQTNADREATSSDTVPCEQPAPFWNKAYEDVIVAGGISEEEWKASSLAREPVRPERKNNAKRKSDTATGSAARVNTRSRSLNSDRERHEPTKTGTVQTPPARAQKAERTEADHGQDQHGKAGQRTPPLMAKTHLVIQGETEAQKPQQKAQQPPPPRPQPMTHHQEAMPKEQHAEATREGTGLRSHRRKKADTKDVLSSQAPQRPADHSLRSSRTASGSEAPQPKKRTRKLTKRRRRSDLDAETDEAYNLDLDL
ncbi:uncharacterized protein LOC143277507 isoform X2 [Babylonia areolata]|uniref:uncharacterized protein LOC143277507 isoform X2 n=1 Tax=Babylonia areolata TaxID=304850 RepID=UPI003FD0B109